MISAIALGVVLGLRHALEADHIAAVAALVTGMSSLRAAALRGAMWGLGHTVTLLLFGGAFVVLGLEVSPTFERVLEGGVGVMLIAIGLDAMRGLRKVHVHEHQHDGARHVHVHAHDDEDVASTPAAAHEHDDHAHPHRMMGSARAFGIGFVHGLAGSAALIVLTAESLTSLAAGLAFIALFGAGSIIGMTAMSVVVALPVQLSARYMRRHVPKVVFAAAAASLGIGLHIVIATLTA